MTFLALPLLGLIFPPQTGKFKFPSIWLAVGEAGTTLASV